jgi:hypothetical protein
MTGCAVWPVDEPCGQPVIETLVYFNPLCAWGELPVCSQHLAEHALEHLLTEETT